MRSGRLFFATLAISGIWAIGLPAAAGTAPEPIQISVLFCPSDSSTAVALAPASSIGQGPAEGQDSRPPAGLQKALEDRLHQLVAGGIAVNAAHSPAACDAVASGVALSGDAPDIVILLSRRKSTGQAVDQARVSFRMQGQDAQVTVLGRVFRGSLAGKTLTFPARSTAQDGEVVVSDGATSIPETEAMAGLAYMLASRKLEALPNKTSDEARKSEQLREAALQALTQADVARIADVVPLTAAVLKQLRALLVLDRKCPAQSAVELLQSAARLAPFNANSKNLAAIAQLKEAQEPTHCSGAAEDGFYASLELDPRNDDAADNLGMLYEMSVNARPENGASGQVDSDEAFRKLEQVFGEDAPPTPYALELGVAGGLSEAVGGGTSPSIAPAARIELSLGRDGTGLAGRVALGFTLNRDLTVGVQPERQGHARWMRFTGEVVGRYRWRIFSTWYLDAAAGLAAAEVLASGIDFERDNSSATGISGGLTASARVGQRAGRWGYWFGLSGSGFLKGPGLRVAADEVRAAVPNFEVSLLAGLPFIISWL